MQINLVPLTHAIISILKFNFWLWWVWGGDTYSFNVNFVDQKFSSFPATCSVGHDYMPHCQRTRTHEQSYFGGSNIPTSINTRNTEDVNGFQRHKHQRQNRTYRRDPQIRSSRKPWSIAQTIDTYIKNLTTHLITFKRVLEDH